MSNGERPGIRDVLNHYGVRTRGAMASCPLHEDRTPSMSINYGEDLFKCFSCGEGGDSWTLIMKVEDASFDEARRIAETAQLWTADGAGSGGASLRGSSYAGGTGRGVSRSKRDRLGGGKYVPSWRRRRG